MLGSLPLTSPVALARLFRASTIRGMDKNQYESPTVPPARKKVALLRWIVLASVLLSLYVGSYVVISRRGLAEAERYGVKGFYYVTPRQTDGWQFAHSVCKFFYSPLNAADVWLGTGRPAAAAPMSHR